VLTVFEVVGVESFFRKKFSFALTTTSGMLATKVLQVTGARAH
jgi:hypothetical protein